MISTVAGSIQQRTEILVKLDEYSQIFNDDKELKTEHLRTLISDLVKINQSLEEQKFNLPSSFWSKHGKKVNNINLGIIILSGAILAATGIFQFVPDYFTLREDTSNLNSNCTTQPAIKSPFAIPAFQAVFSLIIVGIALQALGLIGTRYADKKDAEEIQARNDINTVSLIDTIGEKYYSKFLTAIEEFKHKDKAERSHQDIQKCLKQIEKIPKRHRKIKKEALIPHMIEELSPKNPLFVSYNFLKSSDSPLFLEDHPTSATESSESSLDGEQAVASKSLPFIYRKNSPKPTFNEAWSYIEKTLGTSIKTLEVDGQSLNRDGSAVDTIEKEFECVIEI